MDGHDALDFDDACFRIDSDFGKLHAAVDAYAHAEIAAALESKPAVIVRTAGASGYLLGL
jgi:hypothetical protein